MRGHALPNVVVLEGPNPYIKDEEDKFTPHGYAVLNLDGPTLKEQVLDPNRAGHLREEIGVATMPLSERERLLRERAARALGRHQVAERSPR